MQALLTVLLGKLHTAWVSAFMECLQQRAPIAAARLQAEHEDRTAGGLTKSVKVSYSAKLFF